MKLEEKIMQSCKAGTKGRVHPRRRNYTTNNHKAEERRRQHEEGRDEVFGSTCIYKDRGFR